MNLKGEIVKIVIIRTSIGYGRPYKASGYKWLSPEMRRVPLLVLLCLYYNGQQKTCLSTC